MKLELETTEKGYPAFWEQGGANINEGKAQIICNSKGQPKQAIFIKHKGFPNGKHALFGIETGDYVIEAEQWHGENTVKVFQIKGLKKDSNGKFYAKYDKKFHFISGFWFNDPPMYLYKPIAVAMEKAQQYQCQETMYLKNENYVKSAK